MTNDSIKNSVYNRTHVYLENRFNRTKHMFVVLADKIEEIFIHDFNYSLLDVGGASGEFVYYLNKRFPKLSLSCIDYDNKLIEIGRNKVPNCQFFVGDANNMTIFDNMQFDIATFVGTISIFDDPEISLNECIRVTKPGGIVIVVSQFNDYPIDAIIRWKYSDDDNCPWNRGYNLFSKKTISKLLKRNKSVKSFEWEKFRLPFDLDKQKDLIRTWTEFNGKGDRIFRNGLMEVNLQILTIYL